MRKIVCISIFILFVISVQGDENVTSSASQCKEYYCRSGYDYTEFFKIERRNHSSPNIKVELHFAIKGIRDGHILMSTNAFPDMSESVYEIVIGAGANTYSELRRMRKKFGKVTVMTPNILSPTNYTAFFISISSDGVIEFSLDKKDVLPLISYRDPMPLEINFFSFAAWNGVELKVLYDCPRPPATNTTSESDTLVLVPTPPKELGPKEKLKAELLKNYDPTVTSGDELIGVMIHYKILGLAYDVTTSELSFHASAFIAWVDHRLRWNKTGYPMDLLFFNRNEIWEPNLIVYNSKEIDSLDPGKTKSKFLCANFRGGVVRRHSLKINTWCSPSKNIVHWPRDTHECYLDIGSWIDMENIRFFAIEDLIIFNISNFVDKFPASPADTYTSTEWDLLETKHSSRWIENTPMSSMAMEGMDEEDKEDITNAVRIQFKIARRSHTYTLLFYSPFVAIVTLIIFTFCVPVSLTIKMTLHGLNLMFVAVCLSEILFKLPGFMVQVPHIVMFYLATLASICISIIINALLIKLTTEPKPWPQLSQRVKTFLKSPLASMIGVVSEKVDDTYKSMLVEENGDRDDPKETRDNEDIYWASLVTAIERFMLFGLAFTFIILFFVQY